MSKLKYLLSNKLEFCFRVGIYYCPYHRAYPDFCAFAQDNNCLLEEEDENE